MAEIVRKSNAPWLSEWLPCLSWSFLCLEHLSSCAANRGRLPMVMTLDFAISLERFAGRSPMRLNEDADIRMDSHSRISQYSVKSAKESKAKDSSRSQSGRPKHRRQRSLPLDAIKQSCTSPERINRHHGITIAKAGTGKQRKRSNSSEEFPTLSSFSPGSHTSSNGRHSPRLDMQRKLDLDRRLMDYGLAVQEMQTNMSRALQHEHAMAAELRRQQHLYRTHELQPFHNQPTQPEHYLY